LHRCSTLLHLFIGKWSSLNDTNGKNRSESMGWEEPLTGRRKHWTLCVYNVDEKKRRRTGVESSERAKRERERKEEKKEDRYGNQSTRGECE